MAAEPKVRQMMWPKALLLGLLLAVPSVSGEAPVPGPPNFLRAAVVGGSNKEDSSAGGGGPMLRIAMDGAGVIPVHLDPANAPKTVSAITSLAGSAATGRVHRAEAVPPPRSDGPPYALVQMTVDDPGGALRSLTHEGTKLIERGTVCLIGGTSDFFVALDTHRGWEASMTVFGHVAEPEMKSQVEPILQRPIHQFTHPQYGTVMAMLDTPVGIRLEADADVVAAAPALLAAGTAAALSGPSSRSDGAEWQVFYAENKTPYYYNTRTKTTQWEKPATFREVL